MCWIRGHLDPGLSRRSLRGSSQLEDMGKARKVIMQKAHDRLQSELRAQINIVCLIILRNDMSTIFLQQILSSRLLLVVIVGQKSNLSIRFKFDLLWKCCKNVVDIASFYYIRPSLAKVSLIIFLLIFILIIDENHLFQNELI